MKQDPQKVRTRLTPCDENYATCEKTFVTLTINSGARAPTFVSEHLDIEPTGTITKGGPMLSGKRVAGTYPFNLWHLGTEDKVKSLDARHHLDALLDILSGSKSQLLSLSESPDVKMSVSCYWRSKNRHGGPALWPEQMAGLAEMNLELWFDFY